MGNNREKKSKLEIEENFTKIIITTFREIREDEK